MPMEAAAISYVDRFGAQGVYGRTLGYWEIQHMIIVDNILRAYQAREQSESWAEWATQNKQSNKLLIEAMKLAEAEDATS